MTPWEKIIRAGRRGTGLRLTADEVEQLSSDGAIEQKAWNDEAEREEAAECGCCGRSDRCDDDCDAAAKGGSKETQS